MPRSGADQGEPRRRSEELPEALGDRPFGSRAVGVRRPLPPLVHVVTEMPKTRTAKIMRRVLRGVYCGLPPGDLSSLDNPSSLEVIRRTAGH